MKTWRETLSLKADGHSLVITGAPPAHNRYDRGIQLLLQKVRLLEDVVLTWNEIRELGFQYHLLVDPLDDQPEEDGMDRRYEGPGAEIVTGQQAGGRR